MAEVVEKADKFTNVLPENFPGYFEFSNWSDEDFVGTWAKKEYKYPALKMTKMFIENATPLEVQNIRKKFAKELALREFFKSQKYQTLRANEGVKDANGVIQPLLGSFQSARSYSDTDLQDGIQKCLAPLPEGNATVQDAPTTDIISKLSRDEDGELNTQAVTPKSSLKLKNKEH